MDRTQTLRATARGALAFWEKRRIVFNSILALVVLLMEFPHSLETFYELFIWLIHPAIGVNILYSTAYLGDNLICSFTDPKNIRPMRHILFTAGCLIAIAGTVWTLILHSLSNFQVD